VFFWFINDYFLKAVQQEVCVKQAAQFSTTKKIRLYFVVIAVQ
jgi:hypothetical protein